MGLYDDNLDDAINRDMFDILPEDDDDEAAISAAKSASHWTAAELGGAEREVKEERAGLVSDSQKAARDQFRHHRLRPHSKAILKLC